MQHPVQYNVALAEALVLADAALESLIRTLLDYNNVKYSRDEKYPSLIEKVKQIDKCRQLELRPLQQLHHARNEVQHKYLIPAESQVDQLITNAIIRSNELTKEVINISWTQVSMSDLFIDPQTRGLFQRAEMNYSTGKINESIVYLIATFEYAKFMEQTRIFGSGISWKAMKPSDDDENNSLITYCNSIHDEVEVLKLRIDYKEYRRYCDIAVNVLSPEFFKGFPPTGFTTETPIDEGCTILFAHWDKTLSVGTNIYCWDIDTDPQILDDIKKDWLQFAFQFVEKSILIWQRVSRKGMLELLTESR